MSPDAESAIDRFADPRLGLLATREELEAWVAEGATLDPPLSPEASIRRMLPTLHGGLVADVALKYVGRGLDLDDLIGEGNLGLIRAALFYDPGVMHGDPPMPVRFSTLAVRAIHRQVRRGVQDRGQLVRIPEHLQPYLGPNPPIGPLTRWQAVVLEDARRTRSRGVLSLSPLPGEEDSAIEVSLAAKDERRAAVGDECERLLAALSERERRVVMERYGFHGPIPTYREIVARSGVRASWQSIQHVEMRAIKKLKAAAMARQMTFEGVFGEARR